MTVREADLLLHGPADSIPLLKLLDILSLNQDQFLKSGVDCRQFAFVITPQSFLHRD